MFHRMVNYNNNDELEKEIMMTIKRLTTTCSVNGCNTTLSIEIDEDKYNQYMKEPIFHNVQDMFPELTPGEREFFFLSHICPECWDKLMKEDDDINEEYNEQNLRDGGLS